MQKNLNNPLRSLYMLIGVLLLAYAIYAHLLIPGITLLALIFLGVLFLVAGSSGRCPLCRALGINTIKK